MVNELIQKKWHGSRKFTLKDSKILVESRSGRKNAKYEVRLNELGYEVHYEADNTTPGKIAIGIFLALWLVFTISYFISGEKTIGMYWFITAMFAFLIAIMFLKPHEDNIFLVGGKRNLKFYRNTPSEEEVLSFIENVINHSKQYLKN